MSKITDHIGLLGKKAVCKVTGFKGVITSVSFDLYGCLQAVVTAPAKKDGTLGDGHWFDVGRLTVTGKPVMDIPDFTEGTLTEFRKGPAEKPMAGTR